MNPINWFEKHNKISWLITILIAITIFYMSSKTFVGTGVPASNILSISYHFFAFFFLALFFSFSLIKGKIKNKYLIFTIILISIAYGISDEIHQYFVPGRYCCFQDVLTNSAGIIFSTCFYFFSFGFRRGK